MGLNKKLSTTESELPNPDPRNFNLGNLAQIGKYLIVWITYPDCTNYEGRKILVFRCSIARLKRQDIIDPHFSENPEKLSPIARFVPTREGWQMAFCFVKSIYQN